jgi:hypothetical protein
LKQESGFLKQVLDVDNSTNGRLSKIQKKSVATVVDGVEPVARASALGRSMSNRAKDWKTLMRPLAPRQAGRA